jgi:hypothetical protein
MQQQGLSGVSGQSCSQGARRLAASSFIRVSRALTVGVRRDSYGVGDPLLGRA